VVVTFTAGSSASTVVVFRDCFLAILHQQISDNGDLVLNILKMWLGGESEGEKIIILQPNMVWYCICSYGFLSFILLL